MPRKPKSASTAPPSEPTATILASTAELVGDGANPRRMTDEAAGGLAASLKRFGDLSGIVFNRQTGELVTGHQRMNQIRAEYGDLPIELIDAAAGLHGIRVDDSHFFPVRIVDWTPAVQRAANVAANNTKIQGTFTSDLSNYLLSVEAELSAELPGVLEECLLVELLSAGLDTTEATEEDDGPEDDDGAEVGISESFQVIVQCTDEAHQRQIYEQLTGEGLSCKVLTL